MLLMMLCVCVRVCYRIARAVTRARRALMATNCARAYDKSAMRVRYVSNGNFMYNLHFGRVRILAQISALLSIANKRNKAH